MILSRPGAVADGFLVEDVTGDEAARLDFYEGGFDYATRTVMVEAAGQTVAARVYLPGDAWAPGAPWRLEDWAATWGPTVTLAAREFMALRGRRSPLEVLARYPAMLVRAASALRAAQGAPTAVRRRAGAGDVALTGWQQPYAGFFAVDELRLRHRRFDGTLGPELDRAVFISGDAATVLPYDPGRDRVLLIEQFRPGPFARGDGQPWLLEPVAGRIDAGETPEKAARREAMEEAGIVLSDLIRIAAYYPTPAAKAEYLFSFLGIADLPDSAAGRVGGVADEHEDIRTHLLPFAALMDLVASGEVENGPLLISALFLQRERDRLRGGA
jgi:nudix-type nucleoside diphosphatase (YffH/AdpP family)